MTAEADFAYLHTLAVDEDDHRLLDRIAVDRARILAGGPPPTDDGRPVLKLKVPDERRSWPGGPIDGRSNPTRPGASPPESDRSDPITAGPRRTIISRPAPSRTLLITLNPGLAPATVDTIVEIFRDRLHARLPGFRGEGGGTVVDLGANEGFYTLLLKRLNPGLRLVAAEPLEENYELFKANLEANGIEGVEARRVAVTDREGTVNLESYPGVGTVASTDMLAFPRPWIRREAVVRRTVSSTTLPALLERAGVAEAEILKLDVEGSETAILKAAGKTLRRFRRVVVECHGVAARRECRSILENSGFRLLWAEEKRSGDLYFDRR